MLSSRKRRSLASMIPDLFQKGDARLCNRSCLKGNRSTGAASGSPNSGSNIFRRHLYWPISRKRCPESVRYRTIQATPKTLTASEIASRNLCRKSQESPRDHCHVAQSLPHRSQALGGVSNQSLRSIGRTRLALLSLHLRNHVRIDESTEVK